MKYTCYLIVLIAVGTQLLMANNLKGQSIHQVKIDLKIKDKDLKEALTLIQQRSGVAFIYNDQLVSEYRGLNISARDETVASILTSLLSGTDLRYIEQANKVIIEEKDEEQSGYLAAPPVTVKGRVTDSKGEPLPGATVKVAGTNVAASVDTRGNYTIRVPDGSATLVFSFIGFNNKEVPVQGRAEINVVLEENQQSLQEVVVLGFGQTQKKIAQTGSIASITTEEIKQSPVANIANALAGRLPGLIAVQRSGEPGADVPDLFIRGRATLNTNAPLITIDGVQKESSAISLLDPNEVESITILKDASATALYGIKGANGVIIVRTRRGKEGKPAINASIQRSVQSATRIPQYLDSYNFALLANEAYKNDNPNGSLIPYSDEAIEAYRTGSDPYKYPNVDWLNEMLQSSGMTRADFNIGGGSKMVRYFMNVGYTDQDGLYKAEKNDKYDPNLRYKRYNFRSNIDVDFDEDFSIGLSLFGSIENKNASYTSTNDLFNYLLKQTPNAFPIKYPTGFYGGGSIRANPFQLLNTTGFTQSFNSSLSGMLTATRKLDFITKGLFAKGNYSFDGYFRNNFTRTMNERLAMYNGSGDLNDPNNYTYVGQDQPLSSPASSYGQTRNIWMDLSLNYERVFGDHTVTGLLLANRTQRVLGGEIPYVSQGLVSRVTYNFQSRYFAELNAGLNGTDNFAKGKRYGLFPAVSAGWVISEEKFLKNNPVIDFLKIRTSYGITGNDQLSDPNDPNKIRRWLFVSDYQSGTGYGFGDPLAAIAGKQEGPMSNPDVTWETAHKLNIGLELKLWKNDLLSMNVDLFRERRNDILITRGTVPSIIGVTPTNLPPANLGEIVNKGFEVELTHRKRIGNVSYFVRGNGSFARNKILFMDEVNRTYGYLRRTGHPIGQIFGLTAIGFFQNQDEINNSARQFGTVIPGDIKYRDLNSDGVIDANDEGPIGRSAVPEILYGFSGGVNWKNFDLSFLFQGAANYNVQFSNEGAWEFYNGAKVMVQHLNRWTPATAATATYPVLHYGQNANNHRASSFFMKDASYLRLKNVEVGYTFKNIRLTRQTGLSSLRIFANGMNLLTWDKMGDQSFDPEAPSGKGFFYPQLKVYNVGLSTDF